MANEDTNKKKISFQVIFPFLGLILILLLFSILTGGKLFSASSLKSTMNDGIYILLGTIGFTLLSAMGQMDFSIGFNMGVSCAVCCLVANAVSIYASIPAAIATGLVIGCVNGVIVTKTRISPMIATMGMMFILQGGVLVILNGSVLQAPLTMMSLYTTPLKILLLAGGIVLGFVLLEKTKYGRISKAIGASPETVRQTGINANKYKLITYIIVGGICGILGFVSLARTGSATNSTGGTLLFNCMNATLLGGVPLTGGPTTKFRGALLGALTISFLVTGMTLMRISAQNQQLIKGIIFLIAVGICFDRKNLKVIK
ncbi:MAG: ABC transporter permease [Lachnospiraceae bacterium]|nr:ABC transporter permease [Lachnospiraceae bacterium]